MSDPAAVEATGGGAHEQPDLAVLLVTYNSRAFIDECITAVRSGTSCRHQILLADNASADGTLAHVRATWPDVVSIDMGGNTGFARANNRAMLASTARHVLLLNGDAVVHPGALDAMVRFLDDHPTAGVVAPMLLNPDGTDQGTARSFPTPAAAVFGRRSPLTRLWPGNPWSRRYLAGKGRGGELPFLVDWVSGACLMVPRRVVAQVGALDEGFFMYWEDADWCRRIVDAGYEVWCLPEARVTHAEGASSGGGWPVRQVVRFHRGAYRYYAKHHLSGRRSALRPLAALAMAARGGAIVGRDRLLATRRARRVGAAAGPAEISLVTEQPSVALPLNDEGGRTRGVGAQSLEQGTQSRQQGTQSRQQGTQSRQQGTQSRQQGTQLSAAVNLPLIPMD